MTALPRRAITGYRAVLLHESRPEKWHELFAALACSVCPVLFVERRIFDLATTSLVPEDIKIQPAENFLCARTIKCDENYVLGLALREDEQRQNEKHWQSRQRVFCHDFTLCGRIRQGRPACPHVRNQSLEAKSDSRTNEKPASTAH